VFSEVDSGSWDPGWSAFSVATPGGYFRECYFSEVARLRVVVRRIPFVTIKERLHKLVDELSESEADDALRYIAQWRVDPVLAAFRDAPVDDEPVTVEDEAALAEVDADRAAGVPRISYAELKREHGYP
jgi:hypothetical protein